MPITAFIGVRISWLIVARKALLASFAVSAAARASWVCLNSRAFWIAITAWSAKVLSSAISLSENGLGGWRSIMIEPIPRSSHTIGAPGGRVVADEFDHAAHAAGQIGHGGRVGHVNGTSRADDPRCDGLIERLGEGARDGVERRPAPRGRSAPARRRRAGRCRAARWRTGAGNCRGSCRTPAAASATELLITCSTSAVAVCCSSASLVSLNRRAFWIAITAWSAKVLSSAICLSAERPGVAGAAP